MKQLPKYHWRPELPGAHHPRLNHQKLILPNQPEVFDMEQYMSKIENQGQLGSCTDHAIAAMLEYGENQENGFTNEHFQFIRLSRLFVYYNQRLKEGTINQDDGALISDGIKSLAKYGICEEKFWPYKVRQFRKEPSEEAYKDAATRKIKTYAKVEQSEEALISTLLAGFPIVFGATVYESFESYRVSKTGKIPMPKVHKEKSVGGHGILAVGFNRRERWIKFRNSPL